MLTPDSALADIDRCVMCGLCLPHCPTYRLSLNEAESPRGRLNTMRVLLEDGDELGAKHLQHLDNCLNCLACQSMCPSRVPYGRLIDHTRARLRDSNKLKRSISNRLIGHLSTSAWGGRWLSRFGRFYAGSRTQSVLRTSGLLKLLRLDAADQILPAHITAFRPKRDPSPHAPAEKRVSLLTGCSDPIWSAATLSAAMTLLQACGYRVDIPEQQACCGALDMHEGRPAKAASLVTRNQAAFSPDIPVVAVSTACSAHLAEHSALAVVDIIDFLLQDPDFTKLTFAPLAQAVAVHTPCSQKNQLHANASSEAILRRIPAIELHPLKDNHGCCGAAGTHFLRNPDVAQTLREPILRETLEHAPNWLVSANIGCRLHLATGMRKLETSIEVIHPIELLAQQLRPTEPEE